MTTQICLVAAAQLGMLLAIDAELFLELWLVDVAVGAVVSCVRVVRPPYHWVRFPAPPRH